MGSCRPSIWARKATWSGTRWNVPFRTNGFNKWKFGSIIISNKGQSVLPSSIGTLRPGILLIRYITNKTYAFSTLLSPLKHPTRERKSSYPRYILFAPGYMQSRWQPIRLLPPCTADKSSWLYQGIRNPDMIQCIGWKQDGRGCIQRYSGKYMNLCLIRLRRHFLPVQEAYRSYGF